MSNLGTLEPLDKATDDVNQRIIWVDLEMSGLEIEKERIIEIAVAVSDGAMSKLALGPNIIIHQNDTLLDAMDPWCIKHHGESGLTQAVKDSKISEEMAEREVLEFVQKYTNKGKSPLAGNSIYMDKMFMMKYMPTFCDHMHYRLIDVSTFKELGKRWIPDLMKSAPKKADKHRAIDDIIDSVNELRFYKNSMVVPH